MDRLGRLYKDRPSGVISRSVRSGSMHEEVLGKDNLHHYVPAIWFLNFVHKTLP